MGTNNLKYEKLSKEIAKKVVNIKSEAHNGSVPNIIVHTDNQQLNLKVLKVNNRLADFCKQINFSLIYNSKRVKAQDLRTADFTWTKKVLSNVYCKEIVKSFKLQTFSSSGFDENGRNGLPHIDKRDECKNILNYVPMDNTDKLVFGHLNWFGRLAINANYWKNICRGIYTFQWF